MLMKLFDDKRLLCACLMIFTAFSSLVFCYIMVKDHSNFLSFGPNKHNKLLGVALDTWFKWWITAAYTFISTGISAFASDALFPFISNVIMDHKTEYIPYSRWTCLMIIQCYTIYSVVMSVIGMFVALTQIDFMLVRILADILVNHFTTFWFLRGKKVDIHKYEQWKRNQESLNLTNKVDPEHLELDEMHNMSKKLNPSEKKSSESDALL